MKTNLLLLFSLLVLFSCENNPKPEPPPPPPSVSPESSSSYQENDFVVPGKDPESSWEVQSQGINVSLAKISSETYKKAAMINKNQELDTKDIHPSVKQTKTCWEVKSTAGKRVHLCPNEEKQITKVEYMGFNEGANACVFKEYLMESTPYFVLVNPQNGNEQRVHGSEIYISPNAVHVLSIASDAIDWTGFEIHRLSKDGNLTEVSNCNMSEPPYAEDKLRFNPKTVLWVSDNEAYVHNNNEHERMIEEPSYYRIFIKQIGKNKE